MKDRKPVLVLDTTPFYAEMGGQVGDTGEIKNKSGRFEVTDTVRTALGIVVHRGKMLKRDAFHG